MKGYKVFNSDFTCRGFQYEVDKTYEINGEIGLCKSGFHFCLIASDCFNYYSFNSDNKVAEIEASDIDGETIHGDNKSVTKKITIVREIGWQEVLTIVNIGKSNTGLWNTGNKNTGNKNTGDCNTGDKNTGDWNTGDWNTGYGNTGLWNTGNKNTGHRNTGDWNTGHRNTGDCNTGYGNTGDCNTGDCNTGYGNTGDWNTANFSNGVFCTEESKILIFDKPSNLTLNEWRKTEAYHILNRINTTFWVCSSKMQTQEKELHPEHETTGGFLKTIHIVEAAEKWWKELSNNEKQTIKSIPNFDSEKFYNIVGIRV